MIYLTPDTKEGRSAGLKLAEQGKPGAIIFLTEEEMKAAKDIVAIEDTKPFTLMECHPAKRYILFVKAGCVALKDMAMHNVTVIEYRE